MVGVPVFASTTPFLGGAPFHCRGKGRTLTPGHLGVATKVMSKATGAVYVDVDAVWAPEATCARCEFVRDAVWEHVRARRPADLWVIVSITLAGPNWHRVF